MEAHLSIGQATHEESAFSKLLKPELTEGSDESVSAWVADECNRALGQELSAEEELSCKELAHERKNEGARGMGEVQRIFAR